MDYEFGSSLHLEYLDGLKAEANQLFSRSDLTQASELYYRILKETLCLPNSHLEPKDLKNHAKLLYNRVSTGELTKFLSTVACNMAICQNRMKNSKDAKVYFEIAVILDEYNYKANYHLAHSHLSLNDYNSSLIYIQNCQKIVSSDLKAWKNKHQPHLDLMDQIRVLVKRNDETMEYVNDPEQLVKDICSGLNVNLNLQRLQLVPFKKLVHSESVKHLVQFCQKKLDDGVVDDVLVSVWSCLYHILYKCEDEYKHNLYSQFLCNFNSKEKSLCSYVKQLFKLGLDKTDIVESSLDSKSVETVVDNTYSNDNSSKTNVNVNDYNRKQKVKENNSTNCEGNVNEVNVVSVATNVAKCCPLVRNVDSLEVLVLLLNEDRFKERVNDVVLSSLLVYFSRVDKLGKKEQCCSFNVALMKLLEKLFSMFDEEYEKENNNYNNNNKEKKKNNNEEQLTACLMAIFRMEFGKYEVSVDTFSNMLNISLEAYTSTELDSLSGKPLVTYEHNWFMVVKSLFLANKTLFKNYLVVNEVIQHLLRQLFTTSSNEVKKYCMEIIVNCLDFVEFRQEVLDYVQDHESFMELMNSPDLVRFANLLTEEFSSAKSDKSTNRTNLPGSTLPNVQPVGCSNNNTSTDSNKVDSITSSESQCKQECKSTFNSTCDSTNGVSDLDLSNWFIQTKVLMFSKLSLHSPQVKGEVLNYFDLFGLLPRMVYYNHKNNLDQELVLQIISFASLHEEFKRSDLSFLSLFTGNCAGKYSENFTKNFCGKHTDKFTGVFSEKFAGDFTQNFNEKYRHTECTTLLFVQTVSNLLRGSKDRNNFVEDLELAKYDSDQLKQLKVLQDNLPPEAKITVNGNYFEGNNELANMARSVVFELDDNSVPKYLCKSYRAISSETTKGLIVEALHYLSLNVNHRRYLQSLGAMRIFINVANSDKYQPKENIQAQTFKSLTRYKLVVQSIAHLCIATNPSNLTFNDAHDSIQPLMNLLDDENELFQYEAALALTNLLSINDDVRKRVFALKGWDKFSNLLFSDNEMLKTAGLEGWCNLCGGDDVVHGHFYLQIKTQIENCSDDKVYDINVHDINIMLMFISPSVRPESLSAASGAIALLVRDSRIAQYMPFVSRFENVTKTLNEVDDPAIVHRLLTILSCVIQSKLQNMNELNQNEVDSVFQNIRTTVKKNCNKYVNKTLLDLYHEIC